MAVKGAANELANTSSSLTGTVNPYLNFIHHFIHPYSTICMPP